jgi:hypothetical protein
MLLARLEGELNDACAALSTLEHYDEETVAAAGRAVGAVVDRIMAALPGTVGSLRLQALALLAWHDGNYGRAPGLEELLEAVAHLPPKLWDEPIGR